MPPTPQRLVVAGAWLAGAMLGAAGCQCTSVRRMRGQGQGQVEVQGWAPLGLGLGQGRSGLSTPTWTLPS